MPRLLQIRLVVFLIVYRELGLCEEAVLVHRRELPFARGELACDACYRQHRAQTQERAPIPGGAGADARSQPGCANDDLVAQSPL